MRSFDDRSRNPYNTIPSQELSQSVPFTEPLNQDANIPPFHFSPPLTPLPVSNATRQLTGVLDETASGQRTPVLIRGKMKRPVVDRLEPHPWRHRLKSLVGILVLLAIISFSLLVSTPLGQTVGLGLSPSSSSMQIAANHNGASNTFNSVVAQATATAVYNNQQADGYDPYANNGVTIASGNSPRPWPYGQCTYWANLYYHQLTGWWVNWSGNANQWAAGASSAGWNVSTTPHAPSIIVLMPGVQGASYAYGHVAVVTSVIDSTTVMTSNMNWWAYGGGWGIVSNVPFNYGPGYGVYFVWHP